MNNHLLIGSVILVALYWLLGAVTPNPYVFTGASLLVVLTSGVVLWRYGPTAWDILWNQRRSPAEGGGGSHYAIYGITLVALGAFYSGMFGLLWSWYETPQSWTGTATSGFGRALMAAGFVLNYISPDASRGVSKLPSLFWLATFSFVLIVIGFVVGTQFASP
jgi:hypothetical protein